MKRKPLLIVISIFMCLIISSCSMITFNTQTRKANKQQTPRTTETLTVLEYTNYLKEQKEHYPISDEFIEKYQQTSGGYIDNAKKAGIVVDRQLHSPNQKWHFFVSWLQEVIDNNTISMEDDAESDIYKRLLCPELLLWMYEASNVEPSKVRAAYQVAVVGKVNGTHVSTVAKNMRACVSWDDIVTGVKNNDNIIRIEGLPETISLYAGETTKLTPVLNKEIGTFTYNSNDLNIATVDNQGLITSISSGTTIITVSCCEYPELQKEIVINVLKNESVIILEECLNAKVLVEGVEFNQPITFKNKEMFSFKVEPQEGYKVLSVKVNNELLEPIDGVYSFVVTNDSVINVSIVDEQMSYVSKYNVLYDLGTRVTAKLLDTTDQLMNALTKAGEGNGIIQSISEMTYIYGGANGGRSETAWHTGNILKIGTTSVNGIMTLKLNQAVNYVKITGYVYDNACKIQIDGNNATLYTCTDMNEVSKEIVESGLTSTIVISFDSTDTITIATTNKKPLFITSIEFGISEE